MIIQATKGWVVIKPIPNETVSSSGLHLSVRETTSLKGNVVSAGEGSALKEGDVVYYSPVFEEISDGLIIVKEKEVLAKEAILEEILDNVQN